MVVIIDCVNGDETTVVLRNFGSHCGLFSRDLGKGRP